MENDKCQCKDCINREEDLVCSHDCDPDETECRGCREARLDIEEIQSNIDIARGTKWN
jgi:hypothetical protein